MLLIRKDVLGARVNQRGRKWILGGRSLLHEMRLRCELTALLAKMSRMMATGVMVCMSEMGFLYEGRHSERRSPPGEFFVTALAFCASR